MKTHWKKSPFALLLIAFGLGITLQHYLPGISVIFVAMLIAIIVTVYLFIQKKITTRT